MRRLWVVVAAALFAGCSGGDSRPSMESASPSVDGRAVGTIEVTVTTPEVEPIEGAEVGIQGTDFAGYTDAQGQASFMGIEPGTYTVVAALAGYRSLQERGRTVDVRGGEVSDAKLILERIEVVNASSAYHKILPFNGFMGCSLAGAPGTIGYTTYCSRGVNVAGQGVGDPNDNSTHAWTVDNVLVQAFIQEMKWQPTVPTTAGMLRIGTYRSYSCTGQAGVGQACTPSGQLAEAWGPSPVYGMKLEGVAKNFTKNLGTDAAAYPRPVRTEVRAECSGSCTPMTVVFQQRYEAWVSSFYGLEPPEGWSALPK